MKAKYKRTPLNNGLTLEQNSKINRCHLEREYLTQTHTQLHKFNLARNEALKKEKENLIESEINFPYIETKSWIRFTRLRN